MSDEHISDILEEALRVWRIKRINAKESYALDSFANYLDVSRSVVSMWLSKKRSPNLSSLIQIAPKLEELLGPSVYDRLGIKPPNSNTDPILDEIRKTYYSLPPERRHELLPLIEKYLQEHGFTKKS